MYRISPYVPRSSYGPFLRKTSNNSSFKKVMPSYTNTLLKSVSFLWVLRFLTTGNVERGGVRRMAWVGL